MRWALKRVVKGVFVMFSKAKARRAKALFE